MKEICEKCEKKEGTESCRDCCRTLCSECFGNKSPIVCNECFIYEEELTTGG